MINQVWKSTRVESPGYLEVGKTGDTNIVGWDLPPQGDFSSPSISLVMWFRPFSDLSSPSHILDPLRGGKRRPENSVI